MYYKNENSVIQSFIPSGRYEILHNAYDQNGTVVFRISLPNDIKNKIKMFTIGK